MQKRPSSLAVLAEIFLALAENVQKDSIVFKEYEWSTEEIVAGMK